MKRLGDLLAPSLAQLAIIEALRPDKSRGLLFIPGFGMLSDANESTRSAFKSRKFVEKSDAIR